MNDDHYRAELSPDKYIEVSEQFLSIGNDLPGLLSPERFRKDNTISLKNVLSTRAGANNSYPVFSFSGGTYYFPNHNHKKGAWPATDYSEKEKKSFFGNENSIPANGLK